MKKAFFLLTIAVTLVFMSFNLQSNNEYKNLALNLADIHDTLWNKDKKYPHASSNSEYPGNGSDPAFVALNAIDGNTNNKGHGLQFPSWGPEKRKDLWWKVDFGKNVSVNKIVIYIRADFTPYTNSNHDGYWQTAKINFSDNTSMNISLKRTAEPQKFEFESKTTTFIRISDLIELEPLNWCGFTEVEIWGYE
jgi:hypothetical protein